MVYPHTDEPDIIEESNGSPAEVIEGHSTLYQIRGHCVETIAWCGLEIEQTEGLLLELVVGQLLKRKRRRPVSQNADNIKEMWVISRPLVSQRPESKT